VFLENRVPLGEGLTLAAAGLTTRRLKHSVEQAAEKLARGESLSAEGNGLPPPILCALLTSFPERAPVALRRVARRYHEEAQQRARWISTYLPILLVSGVAFTVVLCYALLSIVPWLMILQQLGRAG
jgi:type II secretory pathway component PulF